MRRRAGVFWVVVLLAASCTPRGLGDAQTRSAINPDPVAVGFPTPKPLSLVVIGDSIAIPTMGCRACKGFDRQYAAFLETETGRPVEIDNRAVSGSTIGDLSDALSDDLAIQQAIAGADVVIISIGFNDGPPWDQTDPCGIAPADTDIEWLASILDLTPECVGTTLAQYRVSLGELYGRVAELGGNGTQVRVTLGVFNNLRGNPGSDGTSDMFAAGDMEKVMAISVSVFNGWNRMDCELAAIHGFACADVYHAFNGPDGTASPAEYLAGDYKHPSTNGQARIASVLQLVDIRSLKSN